MKEKNGFTLIELLAIIIILGIIAVITVPIILNVLEDSKKGVAVDSAHGYVESVNKLYVSRSLNDMSDIDDGTYTVSQLKAMGVSINGNEPSDGWVELVDGNVSSYSLKIGDYVITKYVDSEISVEKRDRIRLDQESEHFAQLVETLGGVEEADGAVYIGNAVEVYYNPVTASVCNRETDSDKYATANSNTGVSTGCMHWYLYSIKGKYANMILDHNISEAGSTTGAWALADDYAAGLTPIMDGDNITGYQIGEGTGSKATSAGITYPDTVVSFSKYTVNGNNARGPVTALNTLKDLTGTWKTGVPLIPNASGTNEYILPASSNHDKYQIDYTGYHARLITSVETTYFDCRYGSSNSCSNLWLVKGTSKDNNTLYSDVYGYWTSDFDIYDAYMSLNVGRNLSMGSSYTKNRNLGVRPVITVLIDDVLS